jgi:hypothetical protein
MVKRKTKRVRRASKLYKDDLDGIDGWLVFVLVVFILSALNATYLLIQRISWAFNPDKIVGTGVFISMFFLLLYCTLIWYAIYHLFEEKKQAVNASILALGAGLLFAFWFNIIGQWIYYVGDNKTAVLQSGSINFVFDLVVTIFLILYLKKSKRVKETFTR